MGRFLEKAALARRPSQFQLLVIVHFTVWAALISIVAPPARAQLMQDGIAAVVNDKVITYLQIEQEVSETQKLLEQNYSGEELAERVKEAKLDVLRALIERELIIQDFKDAKGGFIPDTYINEQVDTVIREQYGGDRVAFIKTLYERGTTMQKYRDDIANNAIVQYMRSINVTQTVLISPYQIEQYYQQNLRLFVQDEQIKVSTIVLRKALFPSQKTGPDGKLITYDPQLEIANEILYKLDTGSEFADLAKSYSEAANKDDGGELGWVTQNGKTAIRPDLWDAIDKLQPGQHTEVITTSDGFYYIVLVEDRKKATVTSLEDVRGQIEQTVISEQSQLRQQNWLDSLRAKAFIKMFL
jgi:parvulin-like peptidyl-prolyl isomerase